MGPRKKVLKTLVGYVSASLDAQLVAVWRHPRYVAQQALVGKAAGSSGVFLDGTLPDYGEVTREGAGWLLRTGPLAAKERKKPDGIKTCLPEPTAPNRYQ